MRADPRWQAARALPRTQKQARQAAFTALREQYGFSQYALHAFAKEARCAWLADHLDAVLAQTLATRAYQALNRVCTGQARRVRFKSRGRGLDSIENKRNDTGLRFVLQPAEEGNQGALLWNDDRLPALIDWHDPVITHGLAQRTKLSQYCHGCGKCVKKALWQRWHACECGIGPVQRDLYSAFLAAYLEPPDILPSCAQYAEYWEGAEARLRAAHERVKERAKAGQVMPQSMGLARARARLPQSSSEPTQEPAFLLRGGRLEAWKEGSEPPLLEHEELSENEREDGEDPSILRRHHPLCDPGCHFQEDAKNY